MRKGQGTEPEAREKLRAAMNGPEVREKRRRGYDGRGSTICEACREGNCKACDGGDCRCVCSLELDRKIIPKRHAG